MILLSPKRRALWYNYKIKERVSLFLFLLLYLYILLFLLYYILLLFFVTQFKELFSGKKTRTCVCLILIAPAETEARSQYPVIVPCQSILKQNGRNAEGVDYRFGIHNHIRFRDWKHSERERKRESELESRELVYASDLFIEINRVFVSVSRYIKLTQGG